MRLMQVKLVMGCLILATLLNGCATLNENECLVADWYQIGYSDGVKGEPDSYLEKHRKACSKHGVATDLSQWLEGREAGLVRYCTANKGYDEGLNNRTYHGVCLGDAATQFEQSYQYGNQLYQQRQRVDNINGQLAGNNSDREKLDLEWSDLRQLLVNVDLRRTERANVLSRMDQIKESLAELAAEQQYLAEQYERELFELDNMEFEHQQQAPSRR